MALVFVKTLTKTSDLGVKEPLCLIAMQKPIKYLQTASHAVSLSPLI